MNKGKNVILLSKLAILLATLAWGTSFFIFKNAIDVLPKWYILTFRFCIGTIVLVIIFHKKLKEIDRKILIHGAVLGIILFLAYTFQTWGLEYTTPGRNAFLTASYVVMTPFIYWVTDKKRPTISVILAALLCITGIFLLSWDGGISISFGDLMSLAGGFFFAMQIVYTSKYAGEEDPVALTIVQFAACVILFLVLALVTEEFPESLTFNQVLPVFYLAIICTSLPMLLQNVGQKHLPSSTTAILLSMEAVFGIIFSVIFYGEDVSFKSATGFLLILASEIASQTNLLNPGVNRVEGSKVSYYQPKNEQCTKQVGNK